MIRTFFGKKMKEKEIVRKKSMKKMKDMSKEGGEEERCDEKKRKE